MLTWDALMDTGTIFGLRTKAWSGRCTITRSMLGVEMSPEVAKSLNLGSLMLVPKDSFKDIQSAKSSARALLTDNSVPLEALGGAWFVIESKYADTKAKLENLITAHNDAVEVFIEAYDANRAKQLPILRKALDVMTKGETEVVNDAMSRIERSYPTVGTVRGSFSLRWQTYSIDKPRGAAAADAIAAEGEEVGNIVSDMIKDLRERLSRKLNGHGTVKGLLQLIEENGKLSKKSVAPTLALLDRLKDLNIAGDAVLDEQIDRVRVWLESSELTDAKPLQSVLTELATGAEEALANAEASLTAVGVRRFGNGTPEPETMPEPSFDVDTPEVTV